LDDLLYVGKIGKSVGLQGENRLILDTDFPQQFKKGAQFSTKRGMLTVEKYSDSRGTIKFVGINTPEDAKKITNLELFTTMEATKEALHLEKDEFFWFDIIGCRVMEGEMLLGVVESIDRIVNTDYIVIDTDEKLVTEKKAKQFLIPYIDRYIIDTDMTTKTIRVEGGFDLLEAS